MSSDAAPSIGPASVTLLGRTHDDLVQLRRRWRAVPARAAMLLVHGIGEHSGRYEHVGAYFAANGIDVLAFDQRGFGRSGGRPAHVDRFEQFLDDVEDLLAERRRLSLPLILFGHSMGGLIVSRYLVDRRPRPDLAILSSPAIHAVVPRWQRLAVPVIGRLLPRLRLPSRIDPEALSRDPSVGRAYAADPLVLNRVSAGLGRALLSTMATTSVTLDRITTPTFVFHGADDALVPPSASEELERLPNVTRRVYPGLRHECLNEPEQKAVLTDIMAWLDEQLAVLN
jgi:alpha-beta hydrolase superfamily lysophospholipase